MTIKESINKSIEIKQKIYADEEIIDTIQQVIDEIVSAYKSGGKVLFCGNGGSAADAQHLAAELSGRFYFDRYPLDAEALHTNTSYLTAVANDYSFDEVYSRLIEARGNKGDILVAISTSGNSTNIIKAIEKANKTGLTTVGLTGASGGKMNGLCKLLIRVPSDDTPRIQESHILIGHIICENVERRVFGGGRDDG
jgi:D-sedoheptulose 7-phosphate isomerase